MGFKTLAPFLDRIVGGAGSAFALVVLETQVGGGKVEVKRYSSIEG